MISSTLILLFIRLFGFSPTLVICVISGHIYPSISIVWTVGWCSWKLVGAGWTWFTWSRTSRCESRAIKSTVILTKWVTLNSFAIIEKSPSIWNIGWFNLLKTRDKSHPISIKPFAGRPQHGPGIPDLSRTERLGICPGVIWRVKRNLPYRLPF